jgi:hypothetical protein
MPDKPESTSADQLHDWCIGLVEDGQGRRNPLEGQWWENLAAYYGDFWVEWDPHRKRLWEPRKRKSWKVRIPINMVQPAVRTELAKLTKNRPLMDVLAADSSTKAVNSAKVGDKMLNKYAEKEFSLARVRRQMLTWASICGTAGIFVDYDSSLDEPIEIFQVNGKTISDMRVVQAYRKKEKKQKGEGGTKLERIKIPQGQLRVGAVAPFQLIWDFSKLSPLDASWMIVEDIYDVQEVKRRWGKDIDGEEDAEPGVMEQRYMAKMDITQTMKPMTPKYQELAKIFRMFILPSRYSWCPKGAHIVFTKNEILKKENFPFRHRELPISVMGHIPNPASQYDMSIVQQIKPLSLEMSKTVSQMIENRNIISNPPWLEPQQARIEKAIESRPGLRLKYNHVPNVPPPQPIQMPDMPQYVKELPEIFRQLNQDLSGQGDVSQGQVPAGARSGVAIAYLEEQDDTKLGPTVAEFEETWERAAWQILQLMAQFYTVPRTVRVYRNHGDPEVFDFYGEMLNGCAGLEGRGGSALPRSKAAKQQFVLDLWDRKLEQDPRRVREMLELSEGESDEWEDDLAQAERENRGMQQGQKAIVEEWFNHNAHLYQHHKTMKMAEYEEWPEQVQDLFKEHCQEHEAYLQKQQAAVAMQQGSAPGTAGFGQQRPEGAPPQFSSEQTPRGLAEGEEG